MQIIPMPQEPTLSPEMAAYVAAIPIDDDPITPEEQAKLAEARAETGPGVSTEELGVRLGVYRAIESIEGGSWLSFQLVQHLAKASDIPLGWGTAQLDPILARMVSDKMLASTKVGGVPRYHRYGTTYVPA